MRAARLRLGTGPCLPADTIVPRSVAVPVPFDAADKQETCALAVKTLPSGPNWIHVSRTGQTWLSADARAVVSPSDVGALPQA